MFIIVSTKNPERDGSKAELVPEADNEELTEWYMHRV